MLCLVKPSQASHYVLWRAKAFLSWHQLNVSQFQRRAYRISFIKRSLTGISEGGIAELYRAFEIVPAIQKVLQILPPKMYQSYYCRQSKLMLAHLAGAWESMWILRIFLQLIISTIRCCYRPLKEKVKAWKPFNVLGRMHRFLISRETTLNQFMTRIKTKCLWFF